MFDFDVALDWVVLIPPAVSGAETAGNELARCIEALRKQSGLAQAVPVEDASAGAPPDTVPVILLNAGGEDRNQNGFSWRAGGDRVEIYGKSGRGLCNGTFDFLSALGISWPEPDRERLPPFNRAHPYIYDLSRARSFRPSDPDRIRRRRLFFRSLPLTRESEPRIRWAARNGIDGVVFPLGKEAYASTLFGGSCRETLMSTANSYALALEAGGGDLSLLVPRRLFRSGRELFRMDGGERKKDRHFCSTNPEAIRILKREAGEIFQAHPKTDVFHLWPERDHETDWCSCPACRAFTAGEQNLIAVCAAADALAELRPGALISYFDPSEEPGEIVPRPNMFRLDRYPGSPEMEKEAWISVEP
jgi:hypothetical protein